MKPTSKQASFIDLPLQQTDEAIVNRLLSTTEPSDLDILDAGRLTMRYAAYKGRAKIANQIARVPNHWNMPIEEIFRRCRALWDSDQAKLSYNQIEDQIGSGNDVVDTSK